MSPQEEEELQLLQALASKRGANAPSGMPASFGQGTSAAPTPPVPPEGPTQPTISPSAQRWAGPAQRMGDTEGRVGQIMAGLGDAGIKGYLGLKQFLGGLSDEEKSVLKLMEKDADMDSGWRTGGNVAGNVAMMAVPGANIARGVQGALKVAPAANALVRALPAIAGGAGSSGATEFALAPTEGEGVDLAGKAKQAGIAALMGGGATAGGQVLKKAVTGLIKPSAEATKLMAEGITPKLQEGAESGLGRFLGRMTAGVMDNSREDREVVNAFVKRIAPKLDTKDMNTSEIIGTTKQILNNDYDQLLKGKKFSFSPSDQDAVRSAARRAAGGRVDTTKIVTSELDDILGQARVPKVLKFSADSPNTGLSRYRTKFQERIDSLAASKNVVDRDAADALRKAKSAFDVKVRDTQLTPDELTALNTNDSRMNLFRILERAGSSPQGQAGVDSGGLMKAARALSKPADFAEGQYPGADLLGPADKLVRSGGNQNSSRSLLVALNRAAPAIGKGVTLGGGATLATSGPIAAAVLGPAYAASLLGQTGRGARALYGNTDAQRKLAEFLRKAGPYASPIGAIPNQEDFNVSQ